jgi:citrate lyase subunit beta/citryl-CoA lyase
MVLTPPAAISRTYLFVPATRIERVEKAHAAGAHAVIVDLEDAVSAADKGVARAAAARHLPASAPVFIRVNGPDTQWFREDLELCRGLAIRGVLVPKAERVEDLRDAAAVLRPGAVVLPLIETARGFANVAALCQAERVERLVFGYIDFQLDLGISGDGDELLYFRSQLVLASRLAGLQPPVDGVTVDLDNAPRLREDTLRARRLGFGGKLCIHPRQIGPVNECFQASAEDIAWAQRVIAAAETAHGGAFQVDGKMVDLPVILKAREILQSRGQS